MITPDMTTDEAVTEWIRLTCECLDHGITADELIAFLRKEHGDRDRIEMIIESVEIIALFWERGGSPKQRGAV